MLTHNLKELNLDTEKMTNLKYYTSQITLSLNHFLSKKRYARGSARSLKSCEIVGNSLGNVTAIIFLHNHQIFLSIACSVSLFPEYMTE